MSAEVTRNTCRNEKIVMEDARHTACSHDCDVPYKMGLEKTEKDGRSEHLILKPNYSVLNFSHHAHSNTNDASTGDQLECASGMQPAARCTPDKQLQRKRKSTTPPDILKRSKIPCECMIKDDNSLKYSTVAGLPHNGVQQHPEGLRDCSSCDKHRGFGEGPRNTISEVIKPVMDTGTVTCSSDCLDVPDGKEKGHDQGIEKIEDDKRSEQNSSIPPSSHDDKVDGLNGKQVSLENGELPQSSCIPADQHDDFSAVNIPVTKNIKSSNSTYMSDEERIEYMMREENRLKTFEKSSKYFPDISPVDLAKAGLYHIGPGDRVRCVYCLNIIKLWEKGDDPQTLHDRLFPTCPR